MYIHAYIFKSYMFHPDTSLIVNADLSNFSTFLTEIKGFRRLLLHLFCIKTLILELDITTTVIYVCVCVLSRFSRI